MTDPVYATAAPFDHPRADIILRSSDNVDFRVFKLFLSLASPFFETLFEIPQPAEPNSDHWQEVRDSLCVVSILEDSKTLDTLLRFCYPCTLADDPTLEVLKDAVDVLEAARKYSLDAIEEKARRAIANPKILEVEPWRCFAIARRGRLREETQPRIPSWFEEIDLITASDLLALLTYHQKCGETVYVLQSDRSWNRSEAYSCFRRPGTRHCGCPQRPTPTSLFDSEPQWYDDHIKETFAALRDKPCKATVQAIAERTVRTVKAQNCEACSPIVSEGMRDFSDLLVQKVEEAVSRASFPPEKLILPRFDVLRQIELQLEFE